VSGRPIRWTSGREGSPPPPLPLDLTVAAESIQPPDAPTESDVVRLFVRYKIEILTGLGLHLVERRVDQSHRTTNVVNENTEPQPVA
jgi:hypothetical protein